MSREMSMSSAEIGISGSDNLAMFNFSAIFIFLPSLPITHILGLVAHCPRGLKPSHWLMYPLRGGKHHCIFQIISWAIWGTSILVALPILLHHRTVSVPLSHIEALSGAAAVGSVFAELFMIKSLLCFDPQMKAGETLYNVRAVPSKPIAATVVVGMGALWISLAVSLVWATEYLQDILSKQVYVALSGACLLVGVTTTYGIGGKYWNARAVTEEAKNAWRFFQPFKGGAAFVATQALGWALFSASCASLLWIIVQIALGFAYCLRSSLLITCAIMGGAYLVLSLSIWTFKGPVKASNLVEATAETVKQARKNLVPKSVIWLPIMALYCPVHSYCTVVSLTFCVLPTTFALALWTGLFTLYYILTSQGNPQHTGSREWPALKEWLRSNLGESLRAWFGSVEVVYEGKSKLDPQQKYLFGYQPHGLYPMGAPYLPLLSEFQQHFPGIHPVPLVASVCFFTPVVRDLCSWCGVRQVAKATFLKSLQDKGSVILVPGGQAELVGTWRFFRKDEYVIYTKHKGFVRIAIETGAALVPVVCLGEISALKNLFNWPALQQWTYKNIGYPVPFLLVGRWGVTPFPRQTGLRFVIGEPIVPPPHTPGTQVDAIKVDQLHAQYYKAVEDLYLKHHKTFPNFAHKKLVMI